EDALDECGWLAQVTRAGTLEDALAFVTSTPIDLVLLDLDLPDSRKSWSFLPLHATAPQIPIVLLVDADQAELAARLVREGAQDYLVKSEVDCIPLRRAIRNALERNRLLEAARADGVIDPPTGLLNARGFLMNAELLRQSALRFGVRMHLHVAESGVADPEERNLILLGLSDTMRESAGPLHAIARIDADRVAALAVDQPAGRGGFEVDLREPFRLELADRAPMRT
ncbi:MAG: response regulator, partial [Bryobacteraceae bacterium]